VRGRLGPRLGIAIVGIAISTLLAVVLMASDRGVTADIRAYIAQPGADLWVAPRGVDESSPDRTDGAEPANRPDG
jgi:hypothetical protein